MAAASWALRGRTQTSFMFRRNPKIQLDDKGRLGFNVRLHEAAPAVKAWEAFKWPDSSVGRAED